MKLRISKKLTLASVLNLTYFFNKTGIWADLLGGNTIVEMNTNVVFNARLPFRQYPYINFQVVWHKTVNLRQYVFSFLSTDNAMSLQISTVSIFSFSQNVWMELGMEITSWLKFFQLCMWVYCCVTGKLNYKLCIFSRSLHQ